MGQVNVKPAAQVEQERLDSLKSQVRTERDSLLRASDYMAMPDYPNPPQGLEVYRQALRDVTDQSGFPESIEWPEL